MSPYFTAEARGRGGSQRALELEMSILDCAIQGRPCKLVSAKENKFSRKSLILGFVKLRDLAFVAMAFNLGAFQIVAIGY